jgi:hypothetical protein
VVVIPSLADEAVLAGRILSLASGRGRDVLLLGVGAGPGQDFELRRKLVTLAAFLREGGSRVEFKVEAARDWMQKLKTIVGPDDMLACCLEPDGCGARTSLNVALSSQFKLPVYVFLGEEPSTRSKESVPAQMASWVGSLAIILAFLWLQIQIVQAGASATYTILLILATVSEIGAIWLWNSSFA